MLDWIVYKEERSYDEIISSNSENEGEDEIDDEEDEDGHFIERENVGLVLINQLTDYLMLGQELNAMNLHHYAKVQQK